MAGASCKPGSFVARSDDHVFKAGCPADIRLAITASGPQAGPGRFDFGFAQHGAKSNGQIEQARE